MLVKPADWATFPGRALEPWEFLNDSLPLYDLKDPVREHDDAVRNAPARSIFRDTQAGRKLEAVAAHAEKRGPGALIVVMSGFPIYGAVPKLGESGHPLLSTTP